MFVNRFNTARREWARGVSPVAAEGGTPTAAFTAPRPLPEPERNSDVLELPPVSKLKRGRWQRFGALVYGAGTEAFGTGWP